MDEDHDECSQDVAAHRTVTSLAVFFPTLSEFQSAAGNDGACYQISRVVELPLRQAGVCRAAVSPAPSQVLWIEGLRTLHNLRYLPCFWVRTRVFDPSSFVVAGQLAQSQPSTVKRANISTLM